MEPSESQCAKEFSEDNRQDSSDTNFSVTELHTIGTRCSNIYIPDDTLGDTDATKFGDVGKLPVNHRDSGYHIELCAAKDNSSEEKGVYNMIEESQVNIEFANQESDLNFDDYKTKKTPNPPEYTQQYYPPQQYNPQQQGYYPQQQAYYPQQQYYPQGQQQYYQAPYYQQNVHGRSRNQPAGGGWHDPTMYEARDPTTNALIFTNNFNTTAIRNRFVQRVYSLLSLMLSLSFGIIIMCMYIPHLKQYLYGNTAFMFICLGGFIVMTIMITCYENFRKTVPLNFILLTITSLFMGFFVGGLSVHYKTHIVLIAIGITVGTTLIVSIFACQTKIDTTGWGLYLYVAMIVIIIFGLVASIVSALTGIRALHVVYSALIALLFSLYLVHDTQQIMGGRRIELSPEEYIAGALSLYIDIMYFLIIILSCFRQSG